MSNYLDRFGDFLLAKAMDSECKRASMRTQVINLSFGPMAFYTNLPDATAYPEAVILLHGAGADKTTWLRFARHLRCQVPVIIPDLPGHGASSSSLARDYAIAAQVQRVEEFMTALRIARAHVIGNSMGGAIAIALAASTPGRVASLTLMAAAGIGTYGPALWEQIGRTGRNPLVTIDSTDDFKAMLRFGMAKPPYLPRIMLSALTRARIRNNPINEKVAADIRDIDLRSKLAHISVPSLIVWGEKDQVLPPQNASLLARALVNSKKVVLPDIGHAPMVEAPEQVAALCSDFLSSLQTGTDAQRAVTVADIP